MALVRQQRRTLCALTVLLFFQQACIDFRCSPELTDFVQSWPAQRSAAGGGRTRLVRQTYRQATQSSSSSAPPTAADPSAEKRAALLAEIQAAAKRTDRGTAMSAQERRDIRRLLTDLARLNPTARPAEAWDNPPGATLVGEWNLIWSDAPDVARPSDVKVGQRIEIADDGRKTVTNVVDVPLPVLTNVGAVTNLNVITRANPVSSSRVDLRIVGIDAARGSEWPAWLPFLNLFSLLPKNQDGSPFGAFDVLYLDDEFRITRTNSGYFSINQRL
eukprot:TRINITY_DN82212_c0_g1_i1.p1 TRINITY_DN82212_c0_g1~~TRINITY_DN82212_c0_g1_i1.p1  ORF type:complete len:274 (+),score=30.27 TRINITY_DN82212_c0_g1_i1:70-891(+)